MIMTIPLFNIINLTFLFKKYGLFPLKNTDNKLSLNRERQKAEGFVEIALFFYSTRVGNFSNLETMKDHSFLYGAYY